MDNLDEESSLAGAYYSQDFEWEALREEVERMPEFSGQQDRPNANSTESLLPSLKERASPSLLRTAEKVLDREEVPSTSTSWEAFHTRHFRNLFFKERRYLTKEFPDLCQSVKPLYILEVGCGTGSSVVPVIRANKQAMVYACDCSAAALQKAAQRVSSSASEPSVPSFHPFLCDISLDKFPGFLCCSACRRQNRQSKETGTESLDTESHEQFHSSGTTNGMGFDASTDSRSIPGHSSVDCCIGGLDIVTMIFILSAIPVEKMAHVLSECLEVLKPGGLLLFRDYGLYDMTMLRFAPRQRISRCLYQREDGTLSYFFSLEVVRALLTQAGFVERELEYCCVQLMNRRKQIPMKRVWVHAKFQKP